MNIGFVQEWGYPRTIAIIVETVTPCSINDYVPRAASASNLGVPKITIF